MTARLDLSSRVNRRHLQNIYRFVVFTLCKIDRYVFCSYILYTVQYLLFVPVVKLTDFSCVPVVKFTNLSLVSIVK